MNRDFNWEIVLTTGERDIILPAKEAIFLAETLGKDVWKEFIHLRISKTRFWVTLIEPSTLSQENPSQSKACTGSH